MGIYRWLYAYARPLLCITVMNFPTGKKKEENGGTKIKAVLISHFYLLFPFAVKYGTQAETAKTVLECIVDYLSFIMLLCLILFLCFRK